MSFKVHIDPPTLRSFSLDVNDCLYAPGHALIELCQVPGCDGHPKIELAEMCLALCFKKSKKCSPRRNSLLALLLEGYKGGVENVGVGSDK